MKPENTVRDNATSVTYYRACPFSENELLERKSFFDIYSRHRYIGAVILCTIIFLIGYAPFFLFGDVPNLLRVSSYSIMVLSVTWVFLSLIRYLRIRLAKPTSRIYSREHKLFSAIYLGENKGTLFLISVDCPEYPSVPIQIPAEKCKGKITEKTVASSPFYKKMLKESRSMRFRLLSEPEKNAFCCAINQIMKEQAEKENLAFFLDKVPFRSYK